MECQQPPALTEDQLSAILDDAPAPELRRHLERCPACAARLMSARRIESALRSSLLHWDCPSAQQLTDYALGRPAAAQVQQHLLACPVCAAEVADLRRSLPPALAPAPLRPALRPIVARFLAVGPAVAVRGRSAGPLLAEAGPVTVVLELRPAGQGEATLLGQVLADAQAAWAGAVVEVRQASAVRAVTVLDEQGGFRCALAAGEPAQIMITPEDEAPVLIEHLPVAG